MMISAQEAKHLLAGATASPWTQGWDDNHGWVAFVAEEGPGTSDEWRVITAADASPATEEGDARLIAAAPDLAQTVIELSDQLDAARAVIVWLESQT